MSAKVSSISSIQSNNTNFIFYARVAKNELAYLSRKGAESRVSGQKPEPYKARTLQYDGNDVEPGHDTPQITAVTYQGQNGGEDQIRVYYVDGKGRLRELCNTVSRTGDLGEWKEGSLDDARFTADPKAPITASVDNDSHQLKIYYTDKEDPEMYCAFVGLYQENWGRRAIADKF